MSKKNVLKVAVIGKNCVGKSVLCSAMAGRTINRDYDMTIGVDLIIKYFKKDEKYFQLSMWDMAGQSRFDSITDAYITTMPKLLFCYSSDNYSSFQGMLDKYDTYKYSGELKNKHIVITMCKCDLQDKFHNAEQSGKEFADKHGYKFVKTSSFTKEGLEELTDALIDLPEALAPLPPPPTIKKSRTCVFL